MKFLKIISSSFHPRSIREHSSLIGNPLGFYGHSQNFTSENDVINLLKFNLNYENLIDPGHDRDILVVSSNSKAFDKGQAYLESINNTKIKRGTIFTMMRENIGYSFGAYNDGFQKFQDNYDYFIFQEDDLVSHIPEYLKIAYQIWIDTDQCGFVPFIAATKVGRSHRRALGISRNEIVSCHGGHGMSSKKVLQSVTKEFGSLPFYSEDDQAYLNHLRDGEIMFTYSIKKIGYRFGELPRDLVLVAPALDLMRGLKIRKNPYLHERFMYYFGLIFKKPLYPILVKIGLVK
jgi:hypothetical protein|tara:strand:+ start:3723 stop:4592 length:870 start_codon:yes stop_codon:yes gene_type:complete